MEPINDLNFPSLFESLEERTLFDGVPDATFVLPEGQPEPTIPAQVTNLGQVQNSAPRELVLIDAGVQEADQLLSEILDSRPDSNLEIRILQSDTNGIDQISQILDDTGVQYDAIHILSHGNEGQLNLGDAQITNENLGSFCQPIGWLGPTPVRRR